MRRHRRYARDCDDGDGGGDSGAAEAADGEEAWGSDVRQSHKRVRRTPEEVASAPYRFVGFLSTSDLVRTLVHEERLPAAALVAAGRRPVSPTLDRMARLGAVAEAFGSRPAISCLSPLGSDGDLLFAGDAPAVSLDMLVRQGMLRYPPRPDRPPSHRVAVFNAAGQVDAIISQSDVVRFLSERLDEVPEAQRTLADLSLGLKAPTAFASTKPAIDCLAEMELQARVAGAAVFDEASGTLVGTLDPTLSLRLSAAPFRLSTATISLWFAYSSIVYALISTPCAPRPRPPA